MEDKGPSTLQDKLISFVDLVGNTLADTAAEAAARRVQPDLSSVKPARRNDSLGFAVAKRLGIIQADIWAKKEAAGAIYELEAIPDEVDIRQEVTNAGMISAYVRAGHRLERTEATAAVSAISAVSGPKGIDLHVDKLNPHDRGMALQIPHVACQ